MLNILIYSFPFVTSTQILNRNDTKPSAYHNFQNPQNQQCKKAKKTTGRHLTYDYQMMKKSGFSRKQGCNLQRLAYPGM